MSDETEAARRGRGRPPKYPWDVWLDGRKKLLRAGVEYPADLSQEALRERILTRARRGHIVVRTTKFGEAGLELSFPYPILTDATWQEMGDHVVRVFKAGTFDGSPDDLVGLIRADAERRGIHIDIKAQNGDVGFRIRPPEATA